MNNEIFIFIFLGLIVGGIVGFTIVALKRKIEKNSALKKIAQQKETFINDGEQVKFPNQDHSHQTKPNNIVEEPNSNTEEIVEKTGDTSNSQKTISKEERKKYDKKVKLIKQMEKLKNEFGKI